MNFPIFSRAVGCLSSRRESALSERLSLPSFPLQRRFQYLRGRIYLPENSPSNPWPDGSNLFATAAHLSSAFSYFLERIRKFFVVLLLSRNHRDTAREKLKLEMIFNGTFLKYYQILENLIVLVQLSNCWSISFANYDRVSRSRWKQIWRRMISKSNSGLFKITRSPIPRSLDPGCDR